MVVTFNRRELLARCVAAIAAQTRRPDTIIVVDNLSTDGTREFLKTWSAATSRTAPRRAFIGLKSNTGGAGGFNTGIKSAMATSHDWVWLMDDDVIPTTSALAELLRAAELTDAANGFYSSLAKDSTLKNTVNVPTIDERPTGRGYANWGLHLAHGIVRIDTATFVSILISRSSILRVGLPIKDFFIWGDDTEYTRRLSMSGIQGYWVGPSEVVHLRPGAQALNIRYETDDARINLYTFLYRNRAYISRKTGRPPLSEYLRKTILDIISLTLKYRSPRRSAVIAKGLLSSFFFGPSIEHISSQPTEERAPPG